MVWNRTTIVQVKSEDRVMSSIENLDAITSTVRHADKARLPAFRLRSAPRGRAGPFLQPGATPTTLMEGNHLMAASTLSSGVVQIGLLSRYKSDRARRPARTLPEAQDDGILTNSATASRPALRRTRRIALAAQLVRCRRRRMTEFSRIPLPPAGPRCDLLLNLARALGVMAFGGDFTGYCGWGQTGTRAS
jgi:hypothetical protein